MRPQAKEVLRQIHSLKRFDDYIRIARAEIASDPTNDKLHAFVTMIETLVREEKEKLARCEHIAA